MARQVHTAQSLPSDTNYTGASLTWTATNSTTADGESVSSTGKDLILARNTNSSTTAYTVTITSVADSLGRTRDMSLSVAADAYAMFGPFRQTGWKQTDGNIYFASTNNDIEFAVLRLPAI